LPGRVHHAASGVGRRSFLRLGLSTALAGMAGWSGRARSERPGRWRIGFANLTEDPAERVEGLGFTGAEVRESFLYAARGLPVEMVFFDNGGNRDKALANAAEALHQKLDFYIQYCADKGANDEIGKRLEAAGIPILAINHAVPGAPLYGATNRFALKSGLPSADQMRLDSSGNPGKAEGLLRRLAAEQNGTKLLVAALDDATALSAKAAVEAVSRSTDTVIVSQGCDRSMHGGFNEKKEIDPQNRGSIVLGSVAYFLDRYGYDVLPLALHFLGGGALPRRSTTQHVLVTAANVFRVYPPIDMN
jgi:ribose transport system substrate-binding protein